MGNMIPTLRRMTGVRGHISDVNIMAFTVQNQRLQRKCNVSLPPKLTPHTLVVSLMLDLDARNTRIHDSWSV